jgi:hypothetical protein
MKLKECGAFLGENSRYFTAVYEEFKFKDDDSVKDYLDFIQHEPVEWIKGFPLKLRTRLSFAKPKAAIIRLLKTPEILTELSAAYCSRAHDVVWDNFKKHGDTILDARLKKGLVGAGDTEGAEGDEELNAEPKIEKKTEPTTEPQVNELFMEVTDIAQEAESVKSDADVPEVKKEDPWKRKYHVVSAALRAVIEHQYGVNKAVLILLDALENT